MTDQKPLKWGNWAATDPVFHPELRERGYKEVVEVGSHMMCFDSDEWKEAGYDQGDNSQFFHEVEILEVGAERARNGVRYRDRIATVRWLHNGRVSRGHFVSKMAPVSTKKGEDDGGTKKREDR